MNVKETIETLQQATRALSGVCDGAATLDGQGFNGCDSGFGKSLAAQDRWSPKQALAAQKILGKYRNQLLSYGIDITALPKLTMEELMTNAPRPARARRNRIDYNPATDSLEFWFDYDFAQKEDVKLNLRAFFKSDNRGKFWKLDLSRVVAETLQFYIDTYRPELSPAAQAKVLPILSGAPDSFSNEQTAIAPAVAPAPAPMDAGDAASVALSEATDADLSGYDFSGFGVNLFPFQRAGVLYALLKKRALIGDDMGLGKTFQALAVIHAAKVERAIVVCPASVKVNWSRAVAEALPGRTVAMWDGKTGAEADIIVINYDNLKKRLHDLRLFRPGCVVFDEAHYLKSSKAQRTAAAMELIDGVEYVLPLTGTPIMNRPAELATILKMIGCLDDFGGWFKFAQRYCDGHYRMQWMKMKGGRAFQKRIFDSSGASNLEELNRKLRAICMVRRRKVDVLTDLPQKLRAQVVFPISNRKEYERAATNLIDYVRACAAVDKAFLATIRLLKGEERAEAIRKHQSERAESAEAAEQLVMIETMKQLAANGKLEAVIEWVNDFIESGEKLVIFATHIFAQEALLNAFPGISARLVAEDNSEQRQANVDRFRKDDKCRLMVASLIAGGTGVDGLQDVCSNVAFFEMGWTPAQHMQAEDRAHRIGQGNQVTCYYLVAEKTIEEDIQQMLAKKQAVCDSVLDGAPEQANGSVFNDLMEVIQGRIL